MKQPKKSITAFFLTILGTALFLAACGLGASSPTAATVPPSKVPPTETSAPVGSPVAATDTPAGATLEPTAMPSPAFDGQTLLQDRCTVCHTLTRVTSAHKTAAQWETTVVRMVGKGAVLSAEEQDFLIQYLAQTYP